MFACCIDVCLMPLTQGSVWFRSRTGFSPLEGSSYTQNNQMNKIGKDWFLFIYYFEHILN